MNRGGFLGSGLFRAPGGDDASLSGDDFRLGVRRGTGGPAHQKALLAQLIAAEPEGGLFRAVVHHAGVVAAGVCPVVIVREANLDVLDSNDGIEQARERLNPAHAIRGDDVHVPAVAEPTPAGEAHERDRHLRGEPRPAGLRLRPARAILTVASPTVRRDRGVHDIAVVAAVGGDDRIPLIIRGVAVGRGSVGGEPAAIHDRIRRAAACERNEREQASGERRNAVVHRDLHKAVSMAV